MSIAFEDTFEHPGEAVTNIMLVTDRTKLWPRLGGMGVNRVRKEFALGTLFQVHEEGEVEEWLRGQAETINYIAG